MLNTKLEQLALALSFTEALKEICQEIKALWDDVNYLKGGNLASHLSQSNTGGTQEGATLIPGLLKISKKLPATTWALVGRGDGFPQPNPQQGVEGHSSRGGSLPHIEECNRVSLQSFSNTHFKESLGNRHPLIG